MLLLVPGNKMLTAGVASLLLLACAVGGVSSPRAATGKRIPSFAGPYVAYVDRYTMCLVDGAPPAIRMAIRPSHFNPMRPGQRQTLSGFIDFTGTGWSDSSWWTRITMDVRSNNQWKPNAFVFNFPRQACSQLRTNMPGLFRSLFARVLKPDVLEGRAPCVIPRVNVTLDKEPVDWVFPNVPVMPYGNYRVKVESGLRGGAAKYCAYTECHLIPKAT